MTKFHGEFEKLLSEAWNRRETDETSHQTHLSAGGTCVRRSNPKGPECGYKGYKPNEDYDDDGSGMQQFFDRVAARTHDRGALMMRVTNYVLADFRSFVEDVFSNRVTQIGVVLAREQMAIRDKYAELECRTLNRAQLVLTRVQEAMPAFDWRRYAAEPDYVKAMVVSNCVARRDADDGSADGVGARGKSLLYQLNWLRSEIDRADCENHGLYEQHNTLTGELAAINAKISDVQCRASGEMAALSAQLDELRARSAEQVSVIDKLMETIQISMQNDSQTD